MVTDPRLISLIESMLEEVAMSSDFGESQILLMKTARCCFGLSEIHDFAALQASVDDFASFVSPDRLRNLAALFHPTFSIGAINHPLGSPSIILTRLDGRFDTTLDQDDLALALKLEVERHLARFVFFIRALLNGH